MLTTEIKNAYISILREELMPATGCTEPIALAYAAARLREVLGAMPERIRAEVSGNIIKNVKGVIVPNTGGMKGIQAAIAKGWRPNAYLTNMSMAFCQDPGDFVATSIFPICPVQLSASYFYTFSKADLARDNVQRKSAYGKVQPAIMGQEDNNYKCEVDQVLVGIDQIAQLNYQRSHAPGVADPRREIGRAHV